MARTSHRMNSGHILQQLSAYTSFTASDLRTVGLIDNRSWRAGQAA
jgi:hypothetical protein